ncbi:uncharacterized protein LOC110900902 [Helianthus annuus]|uniref:uncharacterized protein LOC110900902 n=1 Tax=Helianthus annuus TaxID=4232 RepID=UPI000B8FDAE7|nr:uncharacterized protein LOC110900902 [Helianthus annuus]
MLNKVNYTIWALRIRAIFNVHGVWEAIEPGTETDVKKNNMAIALLFQSIPEEQILQVGNLKTAKEMWDALQARHLGADRVREARLQTLMSEFEALKMKDSSTVYEFSSQLTMSSKVASLGSIIEEQRIVKKFLSGLPRRFIHMVASVEQILDQKTVAFDDVVGRIKAYEERTKDEELQLDNQGTQTKLMFNYSNASSSSRQTSRDSSRGCGKGSNRGRGGGGGRGRNQSGQNHGSQGGSNEGDKQQGKKDYSKVQCFRCDKFGHFVLRYPERKKEKQANLIDVEEIDPSLFMVQDVQEIVYLNEEKRVGGKVKFGDGSQVEICGKGSILLLGKTGEQRLMTDIYYIPSLCSNIISLGQAMECGCDIRMKDDYLLMRDAQGKEKSEAFETFKKFKVMEEVEVSRKIKTFRTDRGGEFTSHEFNRFCENEGIIRHLTAPYSPQQNGVVERRNRTLMEMTRSILKARQVPNFMWGEAVRHSTNLINKTPT